MIIEIAIIQTKMCNFFVENTLENIKIQFE